MQFTKLSLRDNCFILHLQLKKYYMYTKEQTKALQQAGISF